jgi:hypothetical protein
MRIPYVISNQNHRLAEVLNALPAEPKGESLNVHGLFHHWRIQIGRGCLLFLT